MNNLEKIKDVSVRYEIATSTLRYYEKMGLLSSSRDDSSGYRLYDEAALARLQQIIVFRKMNIAISDIRKIFDSNDSGTLLSILHTRAVDIDSEVAELYELKELVLDFIQQLRKIDLGNNEEVKYLFNKATELETSLIASSDSKLEQLLDTSNKINDKVVSIVAEPLASNHRCKMEAFEIVKHEAYKFIGKSVYFRAGEPCGDVWFHDFLYENAKWMWTKLDEMSEYATDITNQAALLTWDKYCEKSQLLGFTYGRFMKADTPVPRGMDYFDIPAGNIGVGIFDNWDEGDHEHMVSKSIQQSGEYKAASWKYQGELLYGNEKYGFFVACEKL